MISKYREELLLFLKRNTLGTINRRNQYIMWRNLNGLLPSGRKWPSESFFMFLAIMSILVKMLCYFTNFLFYLIEALIFLG